MAYTVLARKYRSQQFDEVIGQEPIAQTLKNAIKTGRVAHAYLFTGTRGVGKTTMARILAKSLNCLAFNEPTAEPCCKCDSCIAVNLGEDIDVIEIDGATNNGVEQVRELRQNAIYRPARARFKIYIIDEVHMLSAGAFNALLKILEEPPSHVKFIFATTEPNRVIATIQLRCQRFDFANISAAKIADHLKSVLENEKIKYQQDIVLPLAKMADGSMRDALGLLDRLISTGVDELTTEMLEEFLGCPNSEKIRILVEQLADAAAEGTLKAAEDLLNTGLTEVQIANALVDYMRDLMVIKSTKDKSSLGGLILNPEQLQKARQLAEKFDIAAIIYNITTLEKLRWSLKNNETPKALFEATLLRLALSEHFANVDELLSRLGTAQPPLSHVKKKQQPSLNTTQDAPEKKDKTPNQDSDLERLSDLQSIKNAWQELCAQLGNSTAGLLSTAAPTRFENGVLTVTFPASAEITKKIFESNGRAAQLEELLSKRLAQKISVALAIADGQKEQTRPQKTVGRKKSDLLDNPAVRTVLTELNATVIKIEQQQ